MTQQDSEHIRLLAIFHYVYGAIGVLVTVALGFNALAARALPHQTGMSHTPVSQVWGLFALIFGLAAFLSFASVVLNFIAGWAMSARRLRPVILIASALNCVQVPLGTILGIFTLMAMSRVSVRSDFA